jgi:hypothetical protein
VTLLAHGLGAVQDLPVPLWLFYYGAGAVLIASFVALGALWRKPVLDRYADGRPLSPTAQRILLGPELRVVLGLISVALLVLVFATALVGEESAATNLAPTFVYVVFWLGLVPVVVLIGNVWPALNPWKATADAVASIARTPAAARYPERLGRWPAAVLLFAWAALELAYPNSASPRALALAIALYSWATWTGMAVFGREAWLRNGDGFSVYFALLGRLAPFAVRDGRVVVRRPLAGLAGGDAVPGTTAVLAVMLGSVAFDGFSRTTWWQERTFEIESRYVLDSPGLADLLTTGLNLVGLLGSVVAVAAVFLVAVAAARRVGRRGDSLVDDFVLSLVPIALAYLVAHYFTLLLVQGQAAIFMISDPFGFGWDLFGTFNYEPNLNPLTPNAVWYVQVAALVTGHVLGLVLAHDRATALFGTAQAALRTQYVLLMLMVAYTVGGLWLLSSG